jgi:hypothetical protein
MIRTPLHPLPPSNLGSDRSYFLPKDFQLVRPLEVISGKAFKRVRDVLKALRKYRHIGFGCGDRGHAVAPYFTTERRNTYLIGANLKLISFQV